ncbi:hypothetical protein HYV43_01915 [Candidatus Micrarchaeota archaeon]|nr:hypothetical protein [Candidatus Micrarchaeota archaeon]
MPSVSFTQKGGKHAVALAYAPDEIEELAAGGYFLEAFGRLDKMMDQALFGLMHKRFAQADDLVSAIVDQDFSGWQAAQVLYRAKKLEKTLFEGIRTFKNVRNTVTHDIYGHYALALRQAEQVKDADDLKRKADAKAKSALQEGLKAFAELMKQLQAR